MTITRPKMSRVDGAAIVGIALVSLAAHLGGVEPARRARAEQAAQRDLLRDKVRELEAKDAALRADRAELATLEEKLAAAITLEPPSRMNDRIAAIPELALRVGARVDEVVPKPLQPGRRFTQVPIYFAGDARYPQLAALFAAMREQFPDMQVTAFSISGRPDVPSEPARFTAELIWFARAEGDDGAGTKSTATPR